MPEESTAPPPEPDSPGEPLPAAPTAPEEDTATATGTDAGPDTGPDTATVHVQRRQLGWVVAASLAATAVLLIVMAIVLSETGGADAAEDPVNRIARNIANNMFDVLMRLLEFIRP